VPEKVQTGAAPPVGGYTFWIRLEPDTVISYLSGVGLTADPVLATNVSLFESLPASTGAMPGATHAECNASVILVSTGRAFWFA
jgi:hypothetical protein